MTPLQMLARIYAASDTPMAQTIRAHAEAEEFIAQVAQRAQEFIAQHGEEE